MKLGKQHNNDEGFNINEVIMTTADIVCAKKFWCDLLGLEVLAENNVTDTSLRQLWQAQNVDIKNRLLLGHKHSLCKIHLVELASPGICLREHTNSLDAQAKTINLLVKDLPKVWQRLRELGADLKGEWVEYEAQGQIYRDAHIIGPDHVGVGLVEIIGEDYPVNLCGIGEPVSFTFTVDNINDEQDFYCNLGGQIRLDEKFSGPAIESLVGLPAGGSLNMKLIGPKAPIARLELVSYDHPMINHYSKAEFPAIGVLLVHLEGIKEEVMAEHINHAVEASPWGISKKMIALQAPSGARITVSY